MGSEQSLNSANYTVEKCHVDRSLKNYLIKLQHIEPENNALFHLANV
jgi:hypothetical protein